MDLIIRNVRLSDRPNEKHDIGVNDGRIVAIEPTISADAEIYDAEGCLGCAGLIESHIHLDKSRIINRFATPSRDLNPVKTVAPMKGTFTVEDVRMRAERTLRECILHGTTRMRTQVEVDPGIGLRGFEAVHSLIRDYAWAIDLEICAFPQDGLTNYPGTEELLVESLKRGAKVIGGAPRYDTDQAGQIRRIFELAREFDVDIDIHLDVGNTPDDMNIDLVLELTDAYKWGGRVVVGHMAKLSLLEPTALAAMAKRMANAGVAVTVLPATDLYLMGRDQTHSVRRGVADANVLMAHGVCCSLSSNNVLNPATPYGDCSLIRMANLYANVLQAAGEQKLSECFEMLTTQSARLLNLQDYGLAVGKPADVALIDAETPQEAIAEIRRPRAVFKRGKRTVTWHRPELTPPHACSGHHH
jgi:cytosine deaminase